MNTNLIDNIRKEIAKFETIPLADIKDAKLMRRVDTKYVFGLNQLPQILSQIKEDYYVVEINGRLMHDYETLYFDTSCYFLYRSHHNGIRSRHKIRFRKYVNNNLAFFEIKQKNNKNETIKSRLKHKEPGYSLKENYLDIVNTKIPEIKKTLSPSLMNNFKRITLVNKYIPERVTIDYNISVVNTRLNREENLNQICVLELKRDLGVKSFSFTKVLKELKIKPMGFSKYCMGLVLTNAPVKKNLFKPRLRQIIKSIN